MCTLEGHREESVAFLLANTTEVAADRATAAYAALHSAKHIDVHLYNLSSYQDLVEAGVSEDEDLRVFELGWKGPAVAIWAENPLFLTDDSTLLGKWADLYSDIATVEANKVIHRARVSKLR